MEINKKRFVIKFLLIICGFIFLSACFNSSQNENTQTNEQPAFEIPTPQIDLTKPLEISERPEDVALAKKIDEIIEKSEFSNARWGVFVVSLKDGRVLAARDARKLFTPASVQKILTSAVALDKLGADFRWKTSVYAPKEIANGTLDGDLILYGQGAPDLANEGIEQLVNQLQSKGLKRVKGRIIGDESYFTGDTLGEGWTWNDLQWYYGAEASALSINLNQISVALQNGEARVSPEADFVVVKTKVQPNTSNQPDSLGVKREPGENKIYVWGEGKNLDVRVAVENPALWSAKILKDALIKKGIAVEGDARAADWKSENKTDVSNLTELASIESAPLAEVIRRMNKDSVNLYAELILRTLGKRFGADAPVDDPKMRAVRGDDAAGAAVIKKWLTEKGASFQETETIKDGSGLSRLNFVTPETVGRALIAASQMPAAESFKNSLPVAGTDGTLRGRLTNARGKILGKTGSIAYVNTLAGYASRQDETLAFVILCNNETRKADSSVVIDAIALALLNN